MNKSTRTGKTDPFVTKHGYSRMKERMGLGKKATERMTLKAFYEGITCNELKKGHLKEYLSQKEKLPGSAQCVKVYGQTVYFFVTDGKDKIGLITVFQLPKDLQKEAIDQQKALKTAC